LVIIVNNKHILPVIPATQKVEIGRIAVQDQPRQKFCENPISDNKSDMLACVCGPSYWKLEVRGLESEAGPRQKWETLSKND
jgi:hypothetical protein